MNMVWFRPKGRNYQNCVEAWVSMSIPIKVLATKQNSHSMIIFQITTRNRDKKSIRFNGTDDTIQLKMFSRNTALSPDSYLHSHMCWVVGYIGSNRSLQLWFRALKNYLDQVTSFPCVSVSLPNNEGSGTCLKDREERVEKMTNSNATKWIHGFWYFQLLYWRCHCVHRQGTAPDAPASPYLIPCFYLPVKILEENFSSGKVIACKIYLAAELHLLASN